MFSCQLDNLSRIDGLELDYIHLELVANQDDKSVSKRLSIPVLPPKL